jgi:thimet oligopeptidase
MPNRRLSTFAVFFAVFSSLNAQAQQTYEFPQYPTAAHVTLACKRLIADQQVRRERLQALEPDVRVTELLATLDGLVQREEDTLGPLGLLAAVHPDKAMREEANACDLSYQSFKSSFWQDAKVFQLFKDAEPLDDIQARFLKEVLREFEDAGVALSTEDQIKAREINNQLTRLTQDFDRRLLEDQTRVAFKALELEGVPESVWRQAPKDRRGGYLLNLDEPTAVSVLQNAVRGRTRERFWRAFYRRGGEANLKVLLQLSEHRRAYANLFGFGSYADFLLRRRMAGNEATARQFLTDVRDVVARREVADLELLRASKARHLKKPLSTTALLRWDVSFYRERERRERFAVEQEALRQHFPPEDSLKFVFEIAKRLLGVQLVPVAAPNLPYEKTPARSQLSSLSGGPAQGDRSGGDLKSRPKPLQGGASESSLTTPSGAKAGLWHPDVRVFEASDVATGRLLGTLFVDLYPRAHKYNHAAVWGFRNASTLAQRLPAAALVVNFNRQGLSLDELETLLHEFGHALHVLLSSTRYASQGGTNVLHDFVEAPSQMLEDWVYDPQVIALFQKVCPSCEPLAPGLIDKAKQAKRFAQGIDYARQYLYASYDLALHSSQPQSPLALWQQMESQTPLGHVPGSLFPASFAHIAGGYAAGYYAYLWSEVTSADLRTAFVGHKLDANVGRRWRATVLANGGQVAPQELVEQFLGRTSSNKAFFDGLVSVAPLPSARAASVGR